MSKLPKKLTFVSLTAIALLIGFGAVAFAHHAPSQTSTSKNQSSPNPNASVLATTEPSVAANQIQSIKQNQTITSLASKQTTSDFASVPLSVPTSESKSTNIPTPASGTLSGQVYYDANGNACGIGPTGTCLLPRQKSLQIQDSSGAVIQTAYSDKNGYFSVTLPVGKYILYPAAGDGVNPSAPIQMVAIIGGKTTEVTFVYSAIAVTNTVITN